MAGLNDIVKINISTSGAPLTQPGFGVPLIVGAHTRFSERVRTYAADPANLLADGFTTSDPEYLAFVAICSQSPQVEKIMVGRRALLPTFKVEITPTAVNSKTYTLTINGVDKSFTSDATATVAEITAGLVAAIGAIAGFTVTDNATKITIVANAAGTSWVRIKANDPSLLDVAQTHADPGIATDLAAIALENGAFYGVCMTTASKAEIVAAAAWIESNKKLMVQGSQDTAIITTAAGGATDVAATLKAANYARTATIYHPDNGAFAGAAWLGRCLALDPGSLTWKFKTLAGVATVPLTATHITNAGDKNANWFTDYGGRNMTAEGKVAVGEFIDVIRDRDWFEARLQVRVATLLADSLKVPFTDTGISLVEAQVRAQCAEGVASGFLAADPAPSVTVPKAASVASTDKAARKLTGVKFKGTIAGAIHSLTIDGTITV